MGKNWVFDGENPSYEELVKILKKYKIDSATTLEELLNQEISDNINSGEYLNWCHKLVWLYENKFKKDYRSKGIFAKQVENDLFEYIKAQKNELLYEYKKSHQYEELTLKLMKPDISKKTGLKKSDSIFHVMKDPKSVDEKDKYCKKFYNTKDARNAAENEINFLENFCAIYDISLDFFLKMVYTQNQLENESLDIIKPKLISIKNADSLDTTVQDELKIFLNASRDTLKEKIKTLDMELYESNYYLTVLINAFKKKVDDETLLDFTKKIEQKFDRYNPNLVFHKAKLLSNIGKDKDAIEILTEFEKHIDNHSFNIDKQDKNELHNLLAASYKRRYFQDEIEADLHEAIKLYEQAFKDSKEEDYYPLLNIAYLKLISNNFDNELKSKLQQQWKSVKQDKTWWYLISDVEFSMLMSDWEAVTQKLDNLPDIKMISEFEIMSAIRQIKDIYLTFAPKQDRDEIVALLKKLEEMQNHKDLGANIFMI